MFYEAPLQHPMPIIADPKATPASESPAPPLQSAPLTPEQVQAAEALFAAQERESNQVAALLGLWTGAAILNDIAKDTLAEPAGEPEREEPKREEEE